MAFSTAKPDVRFDIRATDRTKAAFKSARAGLNSMASTANLARGAMVALAGAAAIGAIIKKSLDAADSIGKMSDAIGISTDTLQELRFASELAGITTQALDKAMIKFAKGVGEARSGTGTLITILNKMDPALLRNLKAAEDVDEAFNLVIGTIDEMGNSLDKTALLAAAFGSKAGPQMAVLLKQGVEGLAALRQEAHDLGIVMSEEVIRNAEQANDDLARLSNTLKTQVTVAFAQLAPHISVIANSFTKMTKDSGGFADVVVNNAESVAMAIGKIGDVIQGLQLLWKAAELAGAAVFEFYISSIEKLAQAGVDLVNIFNFGEDFVIPEGLSRSAFNAKMAVADLGIELQDLIEEGMPSANVEAFFEMVREQAARTKELMDAFNAGGAEDEGGNEQAEAELQALRDKMATQLETVRMGLLSQSEVETEAFLNRLLILEESRELELIGLTTYHAMKEKLELKHEAKIAAIQTKAAKTTISVNNKQYSEDLKGLGAFANDQLSIGAQSSRAMFNLKKVAALADAAISLPKTVMEAYEFGTTIGGPPLGAAMAAIAGAAQLANMSAIASASYGGGGGGGGSTGTGNATPVFNADPVFGLPTDAATGTTQTTEIVINLGGQRLLSDEFLRDLIEGINEQVADGVTIGSLRVS